MSQKVLYRDYLKKLAGSFDKKIIGEAKNHNPWFIQEFISESLNILSDFPLNDNPLRNNSGKALRVLYQGNDNVPLESLADVLILLSIGAEVIYRLPEKNDRLMETALKSLLEQDNSLSRQLNLTNKPFSDTDAYIINSNIPDEDLKKYFRNKPVYKKNAPFSAAVLSGKENAESLKKLAGDILLFFGKGKGNVKKIFVPVNYSFDKIFEALEEYNFVKDHHNYYNHYQFSRSVYLLNSVTFLDNDFFMIKEDTQESVPIGVLCFEKFSSPEELSRKIMQNKNIYSVFSDHGWFEGSIPFGRSANICLEPDKKCIEFINSTANNG
jgi:hypothetical protein